RCRPRLCADVLGSGRQTQNRNEDGNQECGHLSGRDSAGKERCCQSDRGRRRGAGMNDNPYTVKFRRKFGREDEMGRYVSALYDVLANTIGSDKLVLRAGKMNALKMMRSGALPDRLCALQRLVFEDPTLERVTGRPNFRRVLGEIEERLADLIAQKNVEDSIERKINTKMVERHQDYLKDLKLEALREDAGPETPATQKKLEELEQLSARGLAASALQLLRPQTLKEVVGQESAIRSLLAKISSPYPQHVILYGPP